MRVASAVGALAVGAVLTACSPVNIIWLAPVKTGTTTVYRARAEAGADNGTGSSFRADVVCGGEAWWRRGTPINVNETPNGPNGTFISSAECYDGRTAVGKNVNRW